MAGGLTLAGVEPIIDVDRETGELLQGWPRCRQAILTILTTRLRTRLMRLWWGCDFLDMQDKPGNMEVMQQSLGAAIAAINKYEPEFQIKSVKIDEFGPDGAILFTIEGVYLPDHMARRIQHAL